VNYDYHGGVFIMEPKYKRVLLKVSGEVLAGDKKHGFDFDTVNSVCSAIKEMADLGTEVAIVVGGGNFWRGRSSENIDRTKADQIGMLATIMNCIYVSEIFRSVGMNTNILTPFECGSFTKLFSKDRANKYFEKGMVVFFAGGTGHPYFSTDTGVVLRAIEVEAEVILLAKAIDGVYDSDPAKNPDAKKYDEVTIDEVIAKNLQVVDMTASILARDNKMPMWVFGLNEENSIVNAVSGEFKGTKVTV
jgi:uridylate kinase